jgi:hypothetical protein
MLPPMGSRAPALPAASRRLTVMQHLEDVHNWAHRALKRNNRAVADNEWKYKTANGFVFTARGIDPTSLGLKDGVNRPDLITLDDIERPGGQYRLTQKDSRLETLLEAIL